MDRLETVLDVGVVPLKGGRYVYARQVSPGDVAVLMRASMMDPPPPVEIVRRPPGAGESGARAGCVPVVAGEGIMPRPG